MRAHALSRSGALVAWAAGTFTYGAGGWSFTLILLAFFVPSVGLSRVGRARKKLLTDIGKGGARDAWQVFANGGVATFCAIVLSVRPARLSTAAWIAAFAGSYAAATADTWGTEIGTLVHGKPHSILTFRPIATGLSGGVSIAGSLAELAGAAWIAAVTVVCLLLFKDRSGSRRSLTTALHAFGPVCWGGVAGALTDSLLGATAQELRRCPACNRPCETNPHVCGTPSVRIRGIRGFSNDAVNFAATFVGATAAFMLSDR